MRHQMSSLVMSIAAPARFDCDEEARHRATTVGSRGSIVTRRSVASAIAATAKGLATANPLAGHHIFARPRVRTVGTDISQT